jgi:hypothetical protein
MLHIRRFVGDTTVAVTYLGRIPSQHLHQLPLRLLSASAPSVDDCRHGSIAQVLTGKPFDDRRAERDRLIVFLSEWVV